MVARRDTHLLFRAGELLSRAPVPTALQKPSGGVRGIVAGEVLRRLVRNGAPGPAVEDFTAPFQFAITTRSGSECVAHTIQALCQTDPELTLTSLDGVSAFDLISRRAMLEGLARVSGGDSALFFVHLFYGRPSTHSWEDEQGVVHFLVRSWPTCRVGCNAGRMKGSERLFASRMTSTPCPHPQVGSVHAIVAEE